MAVAVHFALSSRRHGKEPHIYMRSRVVRLGKYVVYLFMGHVQASAVTDVVGSPLHGSGSAVQRILACNSGLCDYGMAAKQPGY